MTKKIKIPVGHRIIKVEDRELRIFYAMIGGFTGAIASLITLGLRMLFLGQPHLNIPPQEWLAILIVTAIAFGTTYWFNENEEKEILEHCDITTGEYDK